MVVEVARIILEQVLFGSIVEIIYYLYQKNI